MGFPRPLFRAAIAALSVSTLAASGLVFSAAASADPANPTPVSSTALPTAQVNGVVWTQVVSNGIDYVGGSFNQSQPAGAAAGVAVTPRSNLFAFDVATGDAVQGFSAVTNAQVRGMAASPDGSRIYIVGNFTTVNGQPRNHVAAIDRSGALVPGFAPDVNGTVLSVAARGNAVYFGGLFTSVNGAARSRAAAVDTSGGLLGFAPAVADGTVRAVAMSPDGTKVLLGGSFATVEGVASPGMAAVSSATGARMNWLATTVVYDSGDSSAIYSLASRGSVVYATGYNYKGSGNLEGAVAMNWADGSVKWVEDCHGDSYSSVPFNDALYVVSHAHDCGNVVGGWSSPGTPTQWRRAQAFSQSATGVVLHSSETGYADFGGQPSPTLVAGWSPSINTGTYTGSDQGAWSATAGSSFLVLGGEFTMVNGQRQTGLVRFQGAPEAPDGGLASPTPAPTPTPTPSSPSQGAPAPNESSPQRVALPDAVALGATSIAVKWSAPKAASHDKVTSYVVKTYKGDRLVKTAVIAGSKRLAVIGGLKKSTVYRVGVAARNAHGTGASSKLDSVKTRAKGKTVSATKKPSKVQKPSVSVGSARLRVKWSGASTSGALAVQKYQVQVVLHGRTVKTVTVAAGQRVELLKGLKRHTAYTVSVRAANWAGWGSWSTARSVRTK
ncbi:fibronectin type III domain-containing protein [Amnibacterium kyonggiense]|uniref:Fibronectin type III domain protein n=1 Tax=Amnibacterium kyonggiense TaxID=595671 RepID=A0A4R7FFJ7_9MICO|nr:fibronectin type III domain-containing protein [Amnibacterium kyonggiense]TDS74971.1 fibronectin type III domain protein [Amnibacterium kyonggiense]